MNPLHVIGQSRTSAWEMIRALVGVGLLCGLLIVSVYQLTLPIILRNRAEALQRAIFHVLPDARSSTTFRAVGEDGFEAVEDPAAGDRLVYAGYDAERKLIGLAVETRGMGYQDVITVLYGYSFARDAIVGLRVLESKETPGLGDRIEKDEAFLANFAQLDVSLNAERTAVAQPIEPVKHGTKSQAWQVDGITGATISSVAIADMLRKSTIYWIPRIRRSLDDFEADELIR